MKFTIEILKKMSPAQRASLYENARRRLDDGGREFIDLINSSGLPLRSGGMTLSDPVFVRMEEIIWSAEGKKAAIDATCAGLPALAGVEPAIVKELGERYHPHDQGTANAGYIVAELMRHLGYEITGSRSMPAGSIAKTAAFWKPRE